MGESEKPFACPSPGCNMSFINEDHLVVHKKKHDMILNFGSNKTGVFIADQTPTPTRFIRNCEEMGLFQDLQNVNPFEETFRRAVETGKLGSLPDSEILSNDDTLHTPHVFPHIDHDQSGNGQLHSEIPENPCEITRNVTSTTMIKKTTETVVIQEADTSATPVMPTSSSLSINGEQVQLLLKMDDGKLMPVSAIPVCGSNIVSSITNQPLKPQTIVVRTAIPVKCPETAESKMERLSVAKMKLKQVLSKNDSSPDPHKTEQNENTKKSSNPSSKSHPEKPQDVHKKQDILARNRASSMRARAKRKQWVQQLQKSMDNVNELNAVLQSEVKSLRSEVAKLKTLLLAHKDCPITKAMEKDNIVIEAQMIPLSSHFLTSQIPLNTPISPGKRKNSNDSLKPAKRKSSGSLQKQSIILPKIGDKNVPICVTKLMRNSSQPVKVVDLSQVHEKRPNKQILILQNSSPRKIQSITSRQIIQVDQSLQLLNVASKSTGT